MLNVSCPHCGHAMQDDGSLAGQTVACPACGGQFQMPFAIRTSSPTIVRQQNWLPWVVAGFVIGTLVIAGTVAGTILLVDELRYQRAESRMEQNMEKAQKIIDKLAPPPR